MTKTAQSDVRSLQGFIDRFGDLRILVVGDLLLDEYRVGDVDRLSPEAPVPIVRIRRVSQALGGAGNVARNVVSLGARADLVGVVGRDVEGAAVRRLLEEIGMDSAGLVESGSRPTVHKLRVVARAQQMLRLDREEDHPIDAQARQAIYDRIEERLGTCDAIILEDYDKGLFADGVAHWIIERARARKIRVVADPKRELHRFRGADLVKPNLDEAARFVSGSGGDFEARRSLLEKLRDEIGGGEVVVTRGAAGMSGLDLTGTAFDVPTRALEVYDVQGAGDTSVAALALCRAAGASLIEACIVANAAAAIAVEKIGTAAVEAGELRGRLAEALDASKEWGRE